MKHYFFNGCCYPEDGITRIPEGAILLPEKHWFLMLTEIPVGKVIGTDPDGLPVLENQPEPTEEELEKQKHEQWKADRQAKVDAIVVEIDGMKFDGDETSQARMARAGALAESPGETIRWILADNTVVMVTAEQLKRAARAAGLEQEKLWIPEETNPSGQDIKPVT